MSIDLSTLSTRFGHHSESTSPARRRIEEAGRRYASRAEALRRHTESQLESFEAKRLAQQIEETKARLRRQRLIDRFEYAFRLTRNQPVCEKTMREIADEVCEKHSISFVVIKSESRRKDIVQARQEAMYRCRYETTQSYQTIGNFFGGFDHSTVLHAIRKHAERNGLESP